MSDRASQSGFTLLIFLIMLMGIGGVALAGLSQNMVKEIEQKKYDDNREILRQAKQALLMYAYNYASNNPGRGPGRLPCPDTNNNGSPNPSFNCISGSALVGRFPWADPDMNFFDARDSDGERLWYAVSRNFANQISPSTADVINSDSVGSISLADQTGQLIYDATAGNGIAAVIIAPGKAIERAGTLQDRSITNADDPDDTVADTDPGIIDKTRYLDSVTLNSVVYDNDDFVNDGADGFILGPVYDMVENANVVNDQVIVITADEVIAMAEKATLQAYRDAINNYLNNTGNVYPWLFDYATFNLDQFNSNRTTIGRIPSIFSNYFSDADSETLRSEIQVAVSKSFQLTGSGYNLSLNFQTPLSNVVFSDRGVSTDGIGRLSTPDTDAVYETDLWFWDDASAPTGIWSLCPAGADQLSDCNRDWAGNPNPGGSNDTASRVLRVGIRIDLTAAWSTDLDYNTAPALSYSPANATEHARIQAAFLDANVVTFPGILFYERDDYYLANFNNLTVEQQPIQSSASLGDITSPSGTITLGLRYYPELPVWAKSSENDWHNSIQMAYAAAYQPGSAATCTAGVDCIQINNMGGINDNKISILTLAGSSLISDEGGDQFTNDLGDIFDVENDDLDSIFDIRANNGNDKLLVTREL